MHSEQVDTHMKNIKNINFQNKKGKKFQNSPKIIKIKHLQK